LNIVEEEIKDEYLEEIKFYLLLTKTELWKCKTQTPVLTKRFNKGWPNGSFKKNCGKFR